MRYLKDIYIGQLIQRTVEEKDIPISRICNFFGVLEEDILKMYHQKDLSTDLVLRWSKLLKYDFFRLYSHHLILYSAPSASVYNKNTDTKTKTTTLPQFRKNIYTMELIEFILELVHSGEKTKLQIVNEYKIPKTTLYKWINKYNNRDEKKAAISVFTK